MDLKEMEYEYVNYILLTQVKDNCSGIVSTVMNLRVPQDANNILSG
jgi:hypothetical protein